MNKRSIIIVVLLLMVVILFTSQSNKIIRSPVDLRDSSDYKPNVIIIRCDCSCDTIPQIKDSIPIS